jgi:hypothetical protein
MDHPHAANFPFLGGASHDRFLFVVSNPSSAGRRLSDLTRVQPADRTLQNLLGTLSAKLEICSRLPVYEYEAASEGHEASAVAFHELAELERRSFYDLLACLRVHLDTTEALGRETRREAS